MKIDNDIYHQKIRMINVQNELSSLVRSAKDDVVVVLRIHLMCENMIEAWICGAVGRIDFFTTPEELKLTYSDKLRIAYNLSLPKPAFEFFKKINSVRNRFSHNIEIKEIESGLTESLKTITSGLSFAKTYEVSLDTGVEKYGISNPDTPERIKLCFLFIVFTLQISMELQPEVDQGDEEEIGAATVTLRL